MTEPARGRPAARDAHVEAAGDGRVTVTGPLTFDTAAALGRDGLPGGARGGDLHVDLGAVTRADSAGLALLVAWLRDARARGGTIVLESVPDRLAVLVRTNGLAGLLLGEDAAPRPTGRGEG